VTKRILVVNTGSSSVKCAAFELDAAPPVEAQPPQWKEDIAKPTVEEAVRAIPQEDYDLVGHRVVHGGEVYSDTVIIDD
jgi:acetate kinase